MSTGDVLFEQIRQEPDNDQLRLLYADWLEEQSDHRAEFLRLEVQLSQLELDAPEFDGVIEQLGAITERIGDAPEMDLRNPTSLVTCLTNPWMEDVRKRYDISFSYNRSTPIDPDGLVARVLNSRLLSGLRTVVGAVLTELPNIHVIRHATLFAARSLEQTLDSSTSIGIQLRLADPEFKGNKTPATDTLMPELRQQRAFEVRLESYGGYERNVRQFLLNSADLRDLAVALEIGATPSTVSLAACESLSDMLEELSGRERQPRISVRLIRGGLGESDT